MKTIFSGNSEKIRGRKKLLSKTEKEFWERFPELSSDDPEGDQHSQIISILRNTAIKYFKIKEQK